MDNEQTVSRSQAAKMLGVSSEMVRQYQLKGKLNNIGEETSPRYLLSDVESFERKPRGRRKGMIGIKWADEKKGKRK
jgi:hypothetical protein